MEKIPSWTPKSCNPDNIKDAALNAQMQSFQEGVKNEEACKAKATALCEGSSLTLKDDLSDEDICGWMCGYYKAKAVLGCPQDSEGANDVCSGTDAVQKLNCKEFYGAICTGADIQSQIAAKCDSDSANGKAINVTKGTWKNCDTFVLVKKWNDGDECRCYKCGDCKEEVVNGQDCLTHSLTWNGCSEEQNCYYKLRPDEDGSTTIDGGKVCNCETNKYVDDSDDNFGGSVGGKDRISVCISMFPVFISIFTHFHL